MRIVVAAIGRLKQGPERELAERYRKRAADAGRSAGVTAVDIIEIKESRAGDAARRMLEESIAIANIIPDDGVIVLREKSTMAIAFGAATWPHQLARIMLLEQIYRAITLLAGHPYHRR